MIRNMSTFTNVDVRCTIFCNYLGGIGDSGFVSRKKTLFYDLKHKMNLQRIPNPQSRLSNYEILIYPPQNIQIFPYKSPIFAAFFQKNTT